MDVEDAGIRLYVVQYNDPCHECHELSTQAILAVHMDRRFSLWNLDYKNLRSHRVALVACKTNIAISKSSVLDLNI